MFTPTVFLIALLSLVTIGMVVEHHSGWFTSKLMDKSPNDSKTGRRDAGERLLRVRRNSSSR